MKRSISCILAFSLFVACGCTDNAKKAFESGVAASQKGDPDAAIADFTEAIRFNPKFADAYYGRGTVYAGKGDFDQAIADYEVVIRLDPQQADAYTGLAMPTGRRATSTRPLST